MDVDPITTRTLWPLRLLPDSEAAASELCVDAAASPEPELPELLEPPPTEHPIIPNARTEAVIRARILLTDFFIFSSLLFYMFVCITCTGFIYRFQLATLYLQLFLKESAMALNKNFAF